MQRTARTENWTRGIPPLVSADRGFFGCRHFSLTNDWLRGQSMGEIDWRLNPENTPD